MRGRSTDRRGYRYVRRILIREREALICPGATARACGSDSHRPAAARRPTGGSCGRSLDDAGRGRIGGADRFPTVASGARPGPDVLYAPPAKAPQLENVAPFSAAPILVSGATAYRHGEFLYQDFLHDDRGAAGTADTTDPTSGGSLSWKAKAGTLTYPTDPVFANNAADLVELRVKPLADATAFRVTLNTMIDPERVGVHDRDRRLPRSRAVAARRRTCPRPPSGSSRSTARTPS